MKQELIILGRETMPFEVFFLAKDLSFHKLQAKLFFYELDVQRDLLKLEYNP